MKMKVPAMTQAGARDYLARTDWYVTRQAETGEPVPDKVTKKRARAREILSEGKK